MISIITATYNRAYIISKLHESLKEQTSKDFEWIIIDDGSTDDTKIIIEDWIKEKDEFNISYFYEENSGKHHAVNLGVRKAIGDYIFIVDSDDYLISDAIETIHNWIDDLHNDKNFVGVAGLKGYSENQIVGRFPRNIPFGGYIDATNLQRRKYNLLGDKAEILNRRILLKFPFPEFEGEKFIGEEAAWNEIAIHNYKIRWYNKIIYICEYRSDGLTANANKLNENSKGAIYIINQHIKHMPFIYKVSAISVFFKMECAKDLSFMQISRLLETNRVNILLGKILYVLRKYM